MNSLWSTASTSIALLVWGACGSTSLPEPEPPVVDAEATRQADCALLGELSCLDSLECTLRQTAASGYVCGPAASDCETRFVQRLGRAEDCADGCTFVPARCYCAPDVTCICSGGPPAQCLAPH